MVNCKPPMENDGVPAVNVMEFTSKATFTLGESFKPLPKNRLAVPLLAGTRLVSQLRPLVKLESAPPESQVSANAGIETAPTASARANHRRQYRSTLHLLNTKFITSDGSPLKW